MPAPYPPRTPGRSMQSKLNRGAPRGGVQARGLSGVRGDLIRQQAPQLAGLTWVYNPTLAGAWQGSNTSSLSVAAGSVGPIALSQDASAPFISLVSGNATANEPGLYLISVFGTIGIAHTASVVMTYSFGDGGAQHQDAMAEVTGSSRAFVHGLVVPQSGVPGASYFDLAISSKDGTVTASPGDFAVEIYQIIRATPATP